MIAFTSIALAAVILLFCGFWLISTRQTSEILKELNSRLPPVAIIKGNDQVLEELARAAASAREYIYATESATRDSKLLAEIEKAANERRVSYIRILYKRRVRAPLRDQLSRLIGKDGVLISKIDEDHFGYFITESRTLLVIPSVIGSHMLLLKFDDRERAEAIRSSFENISSQSRPIGNVDDLHKVCLDFAAYGSRDA